MSCAEERVRSVNKELTVDYCTSLLPAARPHYNAHSLNSVSGHVTAYQPSTASAFDEVDARKPRLVLCVIEDARRMANVNRLAQNQRSTQSS